MDSDYNGVREHFSCGNELDIAKKCGNEVHAFGWLQRK
mgnify:CR=1 FL=1